MAPYVAFISIAAPRSKFDTPTLRTCFFWADFWNNIEYIGSNYKCHKWYQQMKSQFQKGLYGIVKIRTCCPSAPHDQNVSFKCCHGNTMHKTMGKYYSKLLHGESHLLFLRGLFNAFPGPRSAVSSYTMVKFQFMQKHVLHNYSTFTGRPPNPPPRHAEC